MTCTIILSIYVTLRFAEIFFKLILLTFYMRSTLYSEISYIFANKYQSIFKFDKNVIYSIK